MLALLSNLNIYVLAFILSLAINSFFFIFAVSKQTDKLTDLSYGLSFIAIAWLSLIIKANYQPATLLLLTMINLWGIRLSAYLLIRILTIKKDSRFDQMRHQPLKFAQFWLSQAMAVAIISLPAVSLMSNTQNLNFNLISFLGLVIYLIGLCIETIADWQKFTFKKQSKNKDKWIGSGLWKYSRHPNYFGEMLVWWGVFIYVLPSLAKWQYLTIISPIFICFILLFVTGIPLLEKSYKKKYANDPEFAKYQAQTNLLILGPKTS